MDIFTINVETPVDEQHRPNYGALEAACRSIGAVLKRGALVIVESTVAPGTTERTVRPLLEKASGLKAHVDFYLGACPERVMPGKLLSNLRDVSRVCGGGTPETAALMLKLYRHVVNASLDATDTLTAELVKTTENAYRDVQIAFANEVALICESCGADVWQVRELVNKSPGRSMHLPGAGVGGHCIPKDPWLLAHAAQGDVPLRVIPAGRATNEAMPLHTLALLKEGLAAAGSALAGARVVVLGFSYLEESDDSRNSPSEVLVDRLRCRRRERRHPRSLRVRIRERARRRAEGRRRGGADGGAQGVPRAGPEDAGRDARASGPDRRPPRLRSRARARGGADLPLHRDQPLTR